MIVPAYNCSEYIGECIESVMNQEGDFELILVDDGSTDGTADVLRSYEGMNDKIRMFYCAHAGASGARNKGLDEARGDFVTFIDCDDLVRRGFFADAWEVMRRDADLYIFGIERSFLTGEKIYWTVHNKYYADTGDFADDYIRIRQLLVYSNCNKFYRRATIERLGLRFTCGESFGEDRLFNYKYLMGAGPVVTSEKIMLLYLQRSETSMSTKHVPNYFDVVMRLHEAKMDCILSLAKTATKEEKLAFAAYDLTREIEGTLERFERYPEEVEENLSKINEIAMRVPEGAGEPYDVIMVLGSGNCGYKAEKAFEMGMRNPDARYIVSGGNFHRSAAVTEAEFMADYLMSKGVPREKIIIEDRAKFTLQNLELSAFIIDLMRERESVKSYRIGIVTAAFHLMRVKVLADKTGEFKEDELGYIPAYGPNTGYSDWYKNPTGRNVVLEEIRKLVKLEVY